MSSGYSFLAPEVIQTSAMDCGPAALKAFLGAYGLDCGYERLREACHTTLDGTSIETLEEICEDLGIAVGQHLVPHDQLLDALSTRLPAILVVTDAAGRPHFVVVWRMIGDWVQIMDPSAGRKWLKRAELLERAYTHTQFFSEQDLTAWFPRSSFYEGTVAAARSLLPKQQAEEMLHAATAAGDWRDMAALDLCVRSMTRAIAEGGSRRAIQDFAPSFFARARQDAHAQRRLIPDALWTFRPHENGVAVGGVVFLANRERSAPRIATGGTDELRSRAVALTIEAKTPSAFQELFAFLMKQQRAAFIASMVATILISTASVAEFLLFRAALSLDNVFDPRVQRLVLAVGLITYFGTALALDGGLSRLLARLGRAYELYMRTEILVKTARLGDRYINSRPITDLAQRTHSVHQVRALPEVLFGSLRGVLDLAFTVLAITMIEWRIGIFAVIGIGVIVGSLVLINSALTEIDLRFQTQSAGLLTIFLDALLGVSPVRTHGFEGALRVEQETLLVRWVETGKEAFRVGAFSTAGTGLATTLLSVGLVFAFVLRISDQRALVLLLLWALRLPSQVQGLITRIQSYPSIRNSLLRIVEPLRIARGDEIAEVVRPEPPEMRRVGVSLRMRNLTVLSGGHPVLRGINLDVAPGEHIAIVGRSGAGKSTILSVLLGNHPPQQGTFEIDGVPIESAQRDWLRHITAWVDPTVQLWNRSLLRNIQFGTHREVSRPLTSVLGDSELLELLERLELGMQTQLGSGGSRLSGGEGQRVRFARAILRATSRLVVLDEAFRGLERPMRKRFLDRTRQLSEGTTLICATHDVHTTVDFPRVIVVEDGFIVEDGAPRDLARQNSRYRKLLEADLSADRAIWQRQWARMRMNNGALVVDHEPA